MLPRSFSTTAPSVTAPQAAPFELTNYANVKKRARLIAKVTEDRYMPPWHPVDGHGKFLDERRLSEVELATLKNWQKSGMAEGPADKLPEPPKFESDWLLGEPDLIVTMPKAFTVPADGPDIYRNFVIPLDLKEDKWVAGFEVRPGARSVLHHVIIRLDETGEARRADGARGKPGFSGMRGVGGGRGRSRDVFSGSLGGLGAGQSGGRHGFCRLAWPAISRPGLTLCSTPTCTPPARRNQRKPPSAFTSLTRNRTGR